MFLEASMEMLKKPIEHSSPMAAQGIGATEGERSIEKRMDSFRFWTLFFSAIVAKQCYQRLTDQSAGDTSLTSLRSGTT